MSTQSTFWTGTTGTITHAATAVTLNSLVRSTSLTNYYTGGAAIVSLNFAVSVDCYIVNVSSATTGLRLTANTPFSDSASGVSGNVIDLNQIYIYIDGGSDGTASVYLRSIG